MISVKWDGVTELKGYLEAQRTNKLLLALSVGLNDVAFEIRTEQIKLISSTFKSPKPQTARNVFVKKATKSAPVAHIWFDQIYGKGGIDEYMEANISGGRRIMKPSEQRMGRFFVPGPGAKMDAYGNMQGGQITQILSRLGRFGDAGFNANQTSASKAKRTGAKKTVEYFVVTTRRGGLAPGIYQRNQSSAGFGRKTAKNLPAGSFQRGQTKGKFSSVIQGRGATAVVFFTKKGAPTYKAIWPFYKASQDVADAKLVPYIERAIEMMLRTAR